MTNTEYSPARLLSRHDAELLAAQIFRTKSALPRTRRKQVSQNVGATSFNRRRAEELAAEIFGRKTNFKKGRRSERKRKRLAEKRRRQKEQARCWDWILHDGNVHYARNSSSFATYTRLSPDNSEHLNLGEHGAIGIGTVNLVAPRAFSAPDMCTITLYDVLHIPTMPCNGVSISRLTHAGTEVLQGGYRTVVTHGRAGGQLFEAREILKAGSKLHRICLFGNPQGPSPLRDGIEELPFSIHLQAHGEGVSRFGRAARELKGEESDVRTVSGEIHGVGC